MNKVIKMLNKRYYMMIKILKLTHYQLNHQSKLLWIPKIDTKYKMPSKILKNVFRFSKIALTLCPSQGKNQFEREFVGKIYLAKKKLWELNSE